MTAPTEPAEVRHSWFDKHVRSEPFILRQAQDERRRVHVRIVREKRSKVGFTMGRGADGLMGYRRGRRRARFMDRVSPKGTFVIGLRGFVLEFFFCCPN